MGLDRGRAGFRISRQLRPAGYRRLDRRAAGPVHCRMDPPQGLARGAEIRARHGLGLRLGVRDSVYNGNYHDRPVDDLGLGVIKFRKTY